MKRFVKWLLFETTLGDRLLGLCERHLGVGVLPVESLQEVADALLQTMAT